MLVSHLVCPSEGLWLPREGPPHPQGSTAWLRLPPWLVAIAELWKVKCHSELGIFGLSIKLKMIAEASEDTSMGYGIMQLSTSIRSHRTGKNPNRNSQRSVTKHKALLWPGERIRFPQIHPLWYLVCYKWREGWQRSRPNKHDPAVGLLRSPSHDWFSTGVATSGN